MDRTFVGVLAALLLAGCSDPVGPEDGGWPPPPDVRPFVTGEAATALDARGRFRWIPSVDEATATVSAVVAEALVMGAVRTWILGGGPVVGPGIEGIRETLERHHGGAVDWERVRPGPEPPRPAASPHPPPSDTLHPALRRAMGPFWLVPLEWDSRPVAVVAVSALADNLQLSPAGTVSRRDPGTGGNEFQFAGISRGSPTVIPLAPEQAVAFAAQATGKRVARVPELLLPGRHTTAVYARWRVELEAPVRLRRLSDGSEVVTDVVYVGTHWLGGGPDWGDFAPRLLAAREEQPVHEEWPFPASDGAILPVPIRPGHAVVVDEVEVLPGTG